MLGVDNLASERVQEQAHKLFCERECVVLIQHLLTTSINTIESNRFVQAVTAAAGTVAVRTLVQVAAAS